MEVTNFGTKEIDTPVVTLRGRNEAVVSSGVNICADGPLAPGNSCGVFYAAGTSGFLTVEAGSGKVRATMNIVGSAADQPVQAVIPATK